MRKRWPVLILAIPLLLVAFAVRNDAARNGSGAEMAQSAASFLESLTPEQRAKAVFAFTDEQRFDWHYIPRERKGIPLKELDARQRKLAHDFLKTGLSQRGYLKAGTIMELELVLRAMEGHANRDPELYFFSVFGSPSTKDPWGWRVEGHHLSLNFTVVKGEMVATSPSFFGANPAEVKEGPRKGVRALKGEEEIARQLLLSLDEKQRAQAVFEKTAPKDIVTGHSKQVDPLAPAGIPANQLKAQQVQLLKNLLNEYASSMAPDLAARRLEKVQRAGFEKIHFAWAGSAERFQPHYYRVQGPTFLIEYDNTQNDANHIHSVWRDFEGDFGRDLLREHYRTTPHPQ
jgi:hypothetical protein